MQLQCLIGSYNLHCRVTNNVSSKVEGAHAAPLTVHYTNLETAHSDQLQWPSQSCRQLQQHLSMIVTRLTMADSILRAMLTWSRAADLRNEQERWAKTLSHQAKPSLTTPSG